MSRKRGASQGEFETVLHALKPSKGLFDIAKDMFKNAWDQRLAQTVDKVRILKTDVKKIDKQIEQLMDRIVEAPSSSIVSAYEKRIARLEKQKLIIEKKTKNGGKPPHAYEELFKLALKFLANPCILWDSGQLALRRTVLRLAFTERISYCRDKGLEPRNHLFRLCFYGISPKNVKWRAGEDSNPRPLDS